MRTVLFVITIFLSFDIAHSQSVDDCKSSLINAFLAMKAHNSPPQKGACAMNMSTMAIPSTTSKYTRAKNDYFFYVDRNQRYYQSDMVDFYQDDNESILVIHYQKRILILDKEVSSDKLMDWNKVYDDRDSLIKNATVSNCTKYEKKPGYVKVSLTPSKSDQLSSRMEQMTVVYNPENQDVYQISVHYNSQHKLAASITTFENIDYSYPESKIKKARQHVFKNGSELREKYHGYQIVQNNS